MSERRKRNPVVRFLEKTAVDERGCHIWQSTIHRDGYGKFWFKGANPQAHRVAYTLFKGEIPDGMCVLHKCDVRKCVNPEHLFLGSLLDNIADMDTKGRRKTRAVLHVGQVVMARALLAAGLSQQWIADTFGVHQATISRLKLEKVKTYTA